MESTQHHLDHDTARTQSYLAPCTAPDRDLRTRDGHATTWVTNQRHTARGAFPEQGLSQPAKELTSGDVATARKTVLLAEDDAALRLLFTLRLEQAGFDVLGFETPDDLRLGHALLGTPGHVVLGRLMGGEAHDDDSPERTVGVPIAAVVEAMTTGGLS